MHFLNVKKELHTMVFIICNMHKNYSEKNLVKAIIRMIDKYGLKEKIGYFMPNNTLNDIYVIKIIDLI